jgi:DNA-binding CsgD family transcriptional regulator
MSHADALAVVISSVGVVVLLAVAEPEDALCYLLAVPIWIVSKDLGSAAGVFAGACGLLLVLLFEVTQDLAFGPLGYVGCAIVFFGAAAAGTQAAQAATGNTGASPLLRILTSRPEISRGPEALSRRELEILEMIATGATNAEIAERFVISENTVKSHVSHLLRKLPAANRTQAAFRYIEMYGKPASTQATSAEGAAAEPGRIGATSAVNATVAGMNGKAALVLRLQDDRELEVPVVEQIRDRVGVGAAAIAYFDPHDRVVGWYLPDMELGVDLREWAP